MNEKILVVDDEESLRFTFDFFLSEQGYIVTCVGSYKEAVSLLKEDGFDLIYADVVLDDRTGVDLLKIVREAHPNVPVIMITGMPSIETATESLRQGASDYITKPICQEKLVLSAKRAIRNKALLDEKEACRLNLQAIFRSVKDGIVMVNESPAVVEINDAVTHICGIDRQAVIGKPIRSLAANNCAGACVDVLEGFLKSHGPVKNHFIECHRGSDTNQVVSITTAPLTGPAEAYAGAVMVMRDETRLVQMERVLKENDSIVGKNEAIRKVRLLIKELSDVQTTVLVTGESGTGKELVVDELHHNGDRCDKRLVKLNCAALSENLLESELFGHVAGSFTGAAKNNVGRFQLADGGILFLDEIGEISVRMQLRLLRVIETMEFERVGDATPFKVDVRIVAATNQDLAQKVRQGEFREDLYYRLKVVDIHLPPLRKRLDDIPLLVEHFLTAFNRKFDKKIKDLSTDVWALLTNHHWPGNVRELKNTLEHAFIRCNENVITMDHLPVELCSFHRDGHGVANRSAGQEAEAIRHTLIKARWNKSRAADLLGISRRTIYRKMQKYGIPYA
jgi:PAS domain S-box-containing protein